MCLFATVAVTIKPKLIKMQEDGGVLRFQNRPLKVEKTEQETDQKKWNGGELVQMRRSCINTALRWDTRERLDRICDACQFVVKNLSVDYVRLPRRPTSKWRMACNKFVDDARRSSRSLGRSAKVGGKWVEEQWRSYEEMLNDVMFDTEVDGILVILNTANGQKAPVMQSLFEITKSFEVYFRAGAVNTSLAGPFGEGEMYSYEELIHAFLTLSFGRAFQACICRCQSQQTVDSVLVGPKDSDSDDDLDEGISSDSEDSLGAFGQQQSPKTVYCIGYGPESTGVEGKTFVTGEYYNCPLVYIWDVDTMFVSEDLLRAFDDLCAESHYELGEREDHLPDDNCPCSSLANSENAHLVRILSLDSFCRVAEAHLGLCQMPPPRCGDAEAVYVEGVKRELT